MCLSSSEQQIVCFKNKVKNFTLIYRKGTTGIHVSIFIRTTNSLMQTKSGVKNTNLIHFFPDSLPDGCDLNTLILQTLLVSNNVHQHAYKHTLTAISP